MISILLLASCEEEKTDTVTAAIAPRSTSLSASSGSVWVSVTAGGPWTVSLDFGGSPAWAKIVPSSGEGSRGDVSLRYEENTGQEARSVTLLLSAGSTASAVVTQEGVSSSQGGGNEGGGPNGTDVARALWLELPATEAGDGLTVYTHDYEGGKYISFAKSGVRNWTMYWDAKEHLSKWVAYPLNNALRGSGSRSDVWGLDPLVPISEQPDLTLGSYGGGWTRGHQLPSADRLSPRSANISTFYGTNMTPQQWDFNGGIWASLEGAVRSYASKADTLYVVTGCLYEDSTTYTGVNSGFAVKVPTHYFKALLFRGVSTYASPEGFMAAGFLLPHSPEISGGSYLEYIMSIDELESQTGIDFFPNLAAVVGDDKAAALEAKAPSNWWK